MLALPPNQSTLARMSNWEAIAAAADQSKLGSIERSIYVDNIGPSPELVGLFPDILAATQNNGYSTRFAHNWPSTMRVAKQFVGDGPTSKLLTATQFRGGELTRYGKLPDAANRGDLPASRESSRDGSDPAQPGSREATMYAFDFRSDSGGLGFQPIAKVVVTRPRESLAENGPADNLFVSTTTWLDEEGRVRCRERPEGVAEGFVYPAQGALLGDLTGTPVAEHAGVTINQNGQFALNASTLSSNAVLDVSGKVLVKTSQDGVVTSYHYTTDWMPNQSAQMEMPSLCVTILPHEVRPGKFAGPIVREWYDAQFRVLRSSGFVAASVIRDAASGVATGFQELTEVSRSESDYLLSGQVRESRAWEFTAAAAPFPTTLPIAPEDPQAPLRTAHVYDGDGQEVESTDPGGNVIQTAYDARSRPIQLRRGIVGQPLVLVEERFYDNESATRVGAGDGLLTLTKSYPSQSEARGLRNWYDNRNRLGLSAAVAFDAGGSTVRGPYSLTLFDNQDRSVFTAKLSESAAVPDLNTLTEESVIASSEATGVQRTRYSHRGLVYRTLSLAERPAQATPAKWLIADHWFDGIGREIATTAANSLSTKRRFDTHGRIEVEVQSVDSAGVGFAAATDVDKGFTLQRVDNTYLAGHTVLSRAATSKRVHSSIPTSGPLPDGLPTDPASRVTTYADSLYDSAGRVIATVNYGTNPGVTSPDGFTSVGATAPSFLTAWNRDDDLTVALDVPQSALLMRNFYNSIGQLETVSRRLDGSLKEDTSSRFDSLGRAYAVIENCSPTAVQFSWNASSGRWTPAWGNPTADQDRVTTKVYDKLGQVVQHVAHLRNPEQVQITKYRYAWANPVDGAVPSNSLLYETRYPDPATGEPSTADSDRVKITYDGLGGQSTIEDQNGTIRTFLRDGIGRVVADRVQSFGTRTGAVQERSVAYAIDQRISQIVTRYDGFGRTAAMASTTHASQSGYDPQTNIDPAAGSIDELLGNAQTLNFVRYSYNDLGQVVTLRQGADGPESAAVSPARRELRQRYALTTYSHPHESDAVYQRMTELVYPDPTADSSGDETRIAMNCVGPVDAEIGRISELTLLEPNQIPRTLVKYQRLGGSTFAITDLASIGIQMDRTVDALGNRDWGSHSATSTHGIYGGWDRFGRLIRNSWVESAYGSNPGATPPTTNTRQPVWQERYAYDALSRKTERANTRTVFAYADEDWRYAYDGLDRVIQAQRGRETAAGFTNVFGSKAWTLDELGNWSTQQTFGGGADPEDEIRAHNKSNQLKEIGGLYRFYDPNGNLLIIAAHPNGALSQRVKCTYDAWNRLVRVEKAKPGGWDWAEHAYNPLNWRVKERRHVLNYLITPPPGSPPPGDSQRWIFYSLAWQQLLEVVADTAATPTVTSNEQQFWGLRGTDDAILRRIDINGDGIYLINSVDPSVPERAFYQLVDSSFSPACHIDAGSGAVRQWISYDTYGQMKVLLPSDHNGDGTVTQSDLTEFYNAWKASEPAGDFNGDGSVTSNDYDAFYVHWQAESQASPPTDEARISFAGYVRDPITGWLLARNRWYDPAAGRWVTRDPAGYVDGMSLYLYVKGNPLSLVDPSGLGVLDILLTGEWNPSPEVRAAANAGFVEGAKGGAAIQINAITHGAADAAGITDTSQYADDPAFDGSRMVANVTQAATDTLATGGAAHFAKCGTAVGATVKYGLKAKSAYDKGQAALEAAETAVDVGQKLADGDLSGAAATLGEKAVEAGSQHLAGKAAGKFAEGIPCFAPGTTVLTPDGLLPIETLNVGDRVLTGDPETPSDTDSVDPTTWRLFVLELGINSGRPGRITLLRPESWAQTEFLGVDSKGSTWLQLSIPEMSVEGAVRLLSIEPCPEIKPGRGRVVLMRSITEYEGPMASLKLVGSAHWITGTHGHPVFSEDRCDYVQLGDLKIGERVRTADGWAIVESMARWWGAEVVHNLEVERDHRYLIGDDKILCHNGGGSGGCSGGKRGAQRTPEENHKARTQYKNHKDEARAAWERETGKHWPVDAAGNKWPGEHTPPLKEWGDPLKVTPRNPAAPDPHNIPGPDGKTDYQRWGALGPQAREEKRKK